MLIRCVTRGLSNKYNKNLRFYTSQPGLNSPEEHGKSFPRKIFSGIQPTGGAHLGNYLGAISQWVELQNSGENVTYSIVDLHSITLPQNPEELSGNILEMTATLLACGIDPSKAILFQQSDIQQHTELYWHLGCISTKARLAHLPQFKEKSASRKEVPLGLLNYPVLQAADILLYKATHIPVGDDQLQHLQLCQDLARMFNKRYGRIFPIPHAIILDSGISRIKSLKDPSKKMSKSDPDPSSRICLIDNDDDIIKKIKTSVTDANSKVIFSLEEYPGISNLLSIHSILSGKSVEDICKESEGLDISKYKQVVAENIITHLAPIRKRLLQLISEPQYLMNVLKSGADKASEIAESTAQEMRYRLGLQNKRKVHPESKTDTKSSYYSTAHELNPIHKQEKNFSRKVFSGIQSTGSIHIGNYLAAVRQWVDLQNSGEDVTYCIADLHANALPQNPKTVLKHVLETVAIMLACGIDPAKALLFRQSDVQQHTELYWYLGCISTMESLVDLPHFKKKSASLKEVPLSLLNYPVLQTADILLYKATHIPAGDDQIPNLQFCQDLARTFNNKYGSTFPIPQPIVLDLEISKIKSLRDPSVKMSKSDPDPKSCIYLTDSSEDIIKKTKKSVTDFNSKITFDPQERPGVSNLISIHSVLSGKSIEDICKEAEGMDTLKYKYVVAESIIAHFSPIRQRISELVAEPLYLMRVLEDGANKANDVAEITMQEVRVKLGLKSKHTVDHIVKAVL